MAFYQKPQPMRIGTDNQDTALINVKKSEPSNPPYNYDQLLDEVDVEDLEYLNTKELVERCKQVARILKLPPQFKDLRLKNRKGKGASSVKEPSESDNMRSLIRKSNSHIKAAKEQTRPRQRGLPIGYWKHSKSPLRYAVHATRMTSGRLMLYIADTHEEGIYQGPIPKGL